MVYSSAGSSDLFFILSYTTSHLIWTNISTLHFTLLLKKINPISWLVGCFLIQTGSQNCDTSLFLPSAIGDGFRYIK